MTRNTPNPFQANGSSEQPREFSSHPPGRIAQQAHPPQQLAKFVEFTTEEKTSLNIDLPKYLPPEFTATRSGPARTTLTYIEGWKLKNLANKLFGFDGWSSSITDVTVDFMDVDHEGKVSVGVSIIVRVTLKDGSYHEDIGYGSCDNLKSKASSFEKAKKEAVTDGLKRALTSFGNLMGNCLYDKNFCKHLSTQRVDKPKFDAIETYRCPTEARPMKWEDSLPGQQRPQPSVQQHQLQAQNLPPRSFLVQPQQQNVYGAGTSANPSNQSLSTIPRRNPTPAQQLAQAGSFGSTSGVPSIQSRSETPDANAQHQASGRNHLQQNVKEEYGDDDIFFGADIEGIRESKAESPRLSQESPRISDFDFDVADMMPDDSPVKGKSSEQPGATTPALKRSGTFTRSTSSPVLLQTTPTKPTTRLQPPQPPQFWRHEQKPLPGSSGGQTSTETTKQPVLSFSENPFAPKSPPLSHALPSKASTPPIGQANSHSTHQGSRQLTGVEVFQAQLQKFQPEKDQGSSGSVPTSHPTVSHTANNNKDILRANSLAASMAKPSTSGGNINNQGNIGNNQGNISNKTNVPSSSASTSFNHNTITNATGGFRATTPSNPQHCATLTNPHQGTGLKRPFPVGGTVDRNGSTTVKEQRLG
ncbi:MAG: hypothetical protein J3Q66DRAFT_348134 [Benniella sp.]|nr:MAG: hypothetical protein J3Q66DRAFT_348134 [Benniella sp.]